MRPPRNSSAFFVATAIMAASLSMGSHPAVAAGPAVGSDYEHVLLISVDGMHAVDLANWIQAHPDSNFARLANTGIIYPNAFTTAPSDSYPGMIAQVTGASPKAAGLSRPKMAQIRLSEPTADVSESAKWWGALLKHRRAFIQFAAFSALPALLHAEDQIPAGFKAERYARLWERNPFTLVTPVAPTAQPSAFDKLYIASWAKDDGKVVMFVQNSETNEVEKITAQPNEKGVRLIAMHLNPDPKLVEAVLSDGKEQGIVRFRFDIQPSAEPTALGSARLPKSSANNQRGNGGEKYLPKMAGETGRWNPPNTQNGGLAATAQGSHPSAPLHAEDGQTPTPPAQERWQTNPVVPGPAPEQSNHGEN